MDGSSFFHYDNGSRSGRTTEYLLSSFKGYLQCGGYQAYNVFDEKLEACLVGCMADLRRHFEHSKGEHKSLAEYALGQIQSLYGIECMIDEKGLSYSEHAGLRI